MNGVRNSQPIAVSSIALRSAATGAIAVGAFALGAAAIGALAIGALVVRRVAIRSLSVGRGEFKSLSVDHLTVKRLHLTEGAFDECLGSSKK
jgi:hypothetical protein